MGSPQSVSPGDGSLLSGRTRVDVSESAAGNAVSLTLHAGSAVKGVIRLDGSTEKADWLPQLAMFLRPLGETPQTGSSPLRAQIEPNGAFEVSDVADDSYAPVFIYLPDDYYVKQVQAASQDVLRSGLAIRNGVSDPLSIVRSVRTAAESKAWWRMARRDGTGGARGGRSIGNGEFLSPRHGGSEWSFLGPRHGARSLST